MCSIMYIVYHKIVGKSINYSFTDAQKSLISSCVVGNSNPTKWSMRNFLFKVGIVLYSIRTLSCWLPLPGGYEFANTDVTQSIRKEFC